MIQRDILYDGLLVVTRCSGDVSGEELKQSAHWMIDNYGSLIKPGFCQIFDALTVGSIEVTEDDIHRVAHINLNQGRDRGGFSMAILANQPYPLALAKLHKLLSTAAAIHVEIFSDIDAAFDWLQHENGCLVSAGMSRDAVGY